MSQAGRKLLDRLPGVMMVVVALVQLPAFLMPSGAAVGGIWGEDVRLSIADLAKLIGLFLATHAGLRCAQGFLSGDRTRRAWLLLAGGMAAFAAAQTVLAIYDLLVAGPPPFPSPADVLFLPGMVLIIVALVEFIRTYTSSGMAVASAGALIRTAAIVLVLSLVAGAIVLTPIATGESPVLERVIHLAYPLLDLVALIPAVGMVQLTWRFRGGSLFRGWGLVLAGIFATAVGDVSFAWFSGHDLAGLEPLVDLAFAWSYLMLAWGLRLHASILRG